MRASTRAILQPLWVSIALILAGCKAGQQMDMPQEDIGVLRNAKTASIRVHRSGATPWGHKMGPDDFHFQYAKCMLEYAGLEVLNAGESGQDVDSKDASDVTLVAYIVTDKPTSKRYGYHREGSGYKPDGKIKISVEEGFFDDIPDKLLIPVYVGDGKPDEILPVTIFKKSSKESLPGGVSRKINISLEDDTTYPEISRKPGKSVPDYVSNKTNIVIYGGRVSTAVPHHQITDVSSGANVKTMIGLAGMRNTGYLHGGRLKISAKKGPSDDLIFQAIVPPSDEIVVTPTRHREAGAKGTTREIVTFRISPSPAHDMPEMLRHTQSYLYRLMEMIYHIYGPEPICRAANFVDPETTDTQEDDLSTRCYSNLGKVARFFIKNEAISCPSGK